MPSIREDITKTFLRLSRLGMAQSRSAINRDTIAHERRREGRQFGSYRILGVVGAGGMGEVYLALDTRLGRRIALKFLPPHLTFNEAAVHRFQQEARTASGLNHPNILTIYEVGQIEGEFFIASEYIDGITLRTALQRGSVDLVTAFEIAIQVSSALLAAHSAGVIHRDLKPGNIMIRPDGYVKVIDFGLAKLTQASGPDNPSGEALTGPGSVVGTVDYMSPEQARGDRLDQRTDLWSLGVVLYEMVAHKRPFQGETESHILVSILDKSVPPIEGARALPSRVIEIIHRALAKDRAQRYQSAQELLSDLHQVRLTLPQSGSSIRPLLFSPRSQARRRLGRAAGILGALILACATWWWGLGGKEIVTGPDWFRVESVRQLTFNGRTKRAAISPDGRYLAFVAGEPGGVSALYLKQVDQASEEVKIAPRKIDYLGITFSPDSQSIFEVEEDEAKIGKLYALPLVGDRPRTPMVVDIDGPVSFSPSGDQFAFVRYVQNASTLQLGSAIPNGSQPKAIFSSKDFTMLWRVAWCPKRDQIATFLFSNAANANGDGVLDLLDLKGRESRRALPGWRLIDQPNWTVDAKTLIVSAATRIEGKNHAQLREIDVNSGRIHDLQKDLAGYTSPSLTRDGQQLAAVRLESKASIWISDQNSWGTGHSASTELLGNPTLYWRDENHVMVDSQRGGFPNVWLFDAGSQTLENLTNEPHFEQDAVSAPDGRSIVFSSNRSGEFHIWKFDSEVGEYTQLTSGSGFHESPSISPDGKWVVYTGWSGNNPHLYKAPLGGGKSSQISTYLAKDPEVSPDGKWIACQMQDPNTQRWGIEVIPFEGRGQRRSVPHAGTPFRWSPDGTSLTSVLTDARAVSNLWTIPLDGVAPPRQVTHFDDQAILRFAWSPKGDRLACIRASSGADAVLFKRQKSK